MKNWLANQIQDPIKWRCLNGWLVVFWAIMIPVSILLGLMNLVFYVALLSLYANFATHLSAWAGARAEAKQVEVAETDSVSVNNTNNIEVKNTAL